MEEAIKLALAEEKFDNSASATTWYKLSADRLDATPMELDNVDVVCYKCGKSGQVMARCFARGFAGAKATQQEDFLLER